MVVLEAVLEVEVLLLELRLLLLLPLLLVVLELLLVVLLVLVVVVVVVGSPGPARESTPTAQALHGASVENEAAVGARCSNRDRERSELASAPGQNPRCQCQRAVRMPFGCFSFRQAAVPNRHGLAEVVPGRGICPGDLLLKEKACAVLRGPERAKRGGWAWKAQAPPSCART